MRQKMKSIRAALIIWCLLLLTSISVGAISPQERKKIENALPEKAPAAAKRARKLLVFNMDIKDGVVRQGHTSIPYGNLAIEMMGQKTKAYETVVSSDIAMFRPENIRQFDAICFNNTTGVLFDDAELKKSLLDFISEGKGFIGIHAAAATFVQWPKYNQWPQFGEMLGGYENGGHPWKYNEWITIKLDEPNNKLNAAFKGKGFRISDEVFQFQKPYSRDKLRVLLSIDMEKTKIIKGRLILPERRKDKDFAVSWIRGYGKGRVFYSFLGHNPQTFWNRPILQHYLAGIQFALGDLPADTTPSNKAKQNTARPRPTYADVAYGPHERNVVDFYKVDSDKPTPLVVYFHGGGWRNGSKKDLKHKFCRPVMESGFAFAAANYRLTHHAPHPAQLHDTARAIQFFRSKAKEWNIDPNRIAAYGGSAGGSISLWLALHDDMANPESDDPVARQSSRLSCAISINGQSTNDPRVIRKIIPGKAYDQSALKPLFGLPADWNWDTAEVSDELSARLIDGSPISHLTEDDPPVFCYHTTNAEVPGNIHHPNFGRYLKKKMNAMNIECRFSMDSDYARSPKNRTGDFLAFLRKHFGMKDSK